MSLNSVFVSGNLTRDAKLSTAANGSAVLSFAVAVNQRHLDSKKDEWVKSTVFVDCVMFGRRAEGIADFLKKGTHVAVEGRLSQWVRKRDDGSRLSSLSVRVTDIEFSSSRSVTKKESYDPYSLQEIAHQSRASSYASRDEFPNTGTNWMAEL